MTDGEMTGGEATGGEATGDETADDGAAALTIGWSTLAVRAGGIRVPAGPRSAELLVCVQGDPRPAVPPGMRVVAVPGVGVARSRNAAIDHAGRRYLLFCDDDVLPDVDGVLEAVAHLRRTGRALALGRAVDPDGRPRKRHPRGVRRLTRWNSARAATYEMLVDVEQVRRAGVRFDERFGAGATYYLGDEFIFIADLLRAGLRGDAVPVVVGTHPAESSGSQWGGADGHARAVALNRALGRWAVVARVVFGLRHRRRLGGWRPVVAFVRDGAVDEPAAGRAARTGTIASTPPETGR